MNIRFRGVRNFLARTAPETPMQRIGALVMAFITLLGSVVILMTIATAFEVSWSIAGIAASVFGIALMLCLIPVGIAHGLAAVRPQALDAWRLAPKNRVEEMKIHLAERMKEMYSMVGWSAVLIVLALIIYLFIIRSA